MLKSDHFKNYRNIKLNLSNSNINLELAHKQSIKQKKILTSRHEDKQNNYFFPAAKIKLVSNKFQIKPTLTPNNKIMTSTNNMVSMNQHPKRPKILNRVRLNTIQKFQSQFKIGKILGKGRFGNVCMAKHIITNSLYAVKKINLDKMSPKLLQRIISEIKIQFFLNHQNCLQLYKFYKENNNFILILQVGDLSLFDLLRQRRFFTQRQTAYYIKQVISALQHMHLHGIIHRDVKPQNIVLVNNVVKMADFGWSIYNGKNKRTTFCGTLDYVSPEIILGAEYDQLVDIWSVGVLCYELCTGHAPFQSNRSRQDTYKKIVTVDLKFPRHLSSSLVDFISRLLVKNPTKRMSLQDALDHNWMKQFDITYGNTEFNNNKF